MPLSSERGSSALDSLEVPLQCLRRRPSLVEIAFEFVRSSIFGEFNPDEPSAIERNRMRASCFGSIARAMSA
jgi:hypothetical protein